MPGPQSALGKNTQFIKEHAIRLGFDHCGIARAVRLDDDARRLEQWLHKGLHGSMQYMENHFDKRVDPSLLVPGARSVITLLKNYYPEVKQEDDQPKIAKYAYGRDYHIVIREKLKELLMLVNGEIGEVQGRGFVDSAPVLERSWAQRSGLGWVGKNGNLINKTSGSFYFIATLITDLELNYDQPYTGDFCGTCTRCIDSCPTDAILPDKVIDGSRCISYFTIELKEQLIPSDMEGKFGNWMFGCDTCQDVCPWNRFSKSHAEKEFEPLPGLLNLSTQEWEEMSDEVFKNVFRDSPLQRSKLTGIKRNLRFIKKV
jgi:epoxyqueuosine reductase